MAMDNSPYVLELEKWTIHLLRNRTILFVDNRKNYFINAPYNSVDICSFFNMNLENICLTIFGSLLQSKVTLKPWPTSLAPSLKLLSVQLGEASQSASIIAVMTIQMW